ncbi:sensor histidine kinase [Psychroflexus lacisalsi]|jgi:signal transduction histidine kinase|uniref:Signal transduction histidine kinase internal region domain-containing protein n=1 Tax=Psychroflexus lacisalsi TaxID=503928 RepID=A0ABP3VK07_9FLAO|nr:histidine kinase [Psychroflexus lacisalsi]MBZ9619537.1 histidine kinase [Psychroflexus lacisalsi]
MKETPFQLLIKFIWISAVIALFIHIINSMGNNWSITYITNYKHLLVNFAYAFIIGIFNISFIELIQSKFTWRKEPKTLILIGIPGTVVVSVMGFFLARIVHSVWIYGNSLSYFWKNEGVVSYVFAVLIAIIVSLAFHAYYFYKFGAEAELRAQREMLENTKAKHKALQDQLDPHFLFNSLSVLASLIEEDPKRATEFTTSLSKVYRYVLDQRQEDLVSISSELNFAKVYLNLLSTRFEDSLEYNIDISDESNFIVPLSLQLLIENAVKHNKVTEKNPLKIRIFKTEDHLVIQNNVNPKAKDSERNGIGLLNIKKRFEVYTETPIEIENNSDTFTVKLPLIKTQNS